MIAAATKKVPGALMRASSKRPTAKRVFENMRPSCQQRYAAPVERSETKEDREKRVTTAMRGIIKYGNIRPRLKSKLYRKRTTRAR